MIYLFIVILGLFVGSFLNVLIWRLPEKTFFTYARSRCRHCLQVIPWWWNIPVLSYALLRGRTRCCSEVLSPQYPLVEVVTGLLFGLSFFLWPFLQNGPLAIDLLQYLRFQHFVILYCALIVAAAIDMRHMIIPDVISLGLLALAPLMVWLHPELEWKASLAGAFLGGGILYVLAWGYFLVRRRVGLGFGDVKLLAAIGAWLGYQAVFPTLFLGSIVGCIFAFAYLLYERKWNLQIALPFGPFLVVGSFISVVFWRHIRDYLLF